MTLANLANNLGGVIVNYKESTTVLDDVANKELQDQVVEETFQLPMVQRLDYATLVTDKLLQSKAYPLAYITIVANRKAARLQRGDAFLFSYSPYGIVDMVCRVINVQEESLTSENVVLTVREDINYISTLLDTTNSTLLGATGQTEIPVPQWLEPLTDVKIIESPYIVAGDEVGVLPIASRKTFNELGFQVYVSIDDGTSYSLIGNVPSYAPSGTLVADYPGPGETDREIDDSIEGFEIDSEDEDIQNISSITRPELFLEQNFGLLGDEFISFQTINPTGTDNRYKITKVYRGRLDSERVDHSPGEKFYHLGDVNSRHLTSSKIVPGAVLKFKLVPYSKYIGDISLATAIDVTISGRSRTPYPPLNLKLNDTLVNPFYTTDIIASWDPRLRTEGAGMGEANSITDASPEWEGLFEAEVYVLDVLVRTVSDISAITWTYTEAMNISDNGTPADEVTIKIANYIISRNYKHISSQIEKTATKE